MKARGAVTPNAAEMELERLLAVSLRALEQVADCDARLEECIQNRQGSALQGLLAERQRAVARLLRLGEKLRGVDKAATISTRRVHYLRHKVQQAAQVAVCRNRAYVARLREEISLFQRELNSLQNDGTLLKRYFGPTQSQAEFNG